MRRHDPLGYHTGSVGPHDTAIAVAGLEPHLPHGRIDLDPVLPPGASRLSVRGLPSHLAVVRSAA